MGRIVVSENATLDGVISDPTGEAGSASGGWFTRMSEQDVAVWGEHEHAEAESPAALLLGGGTYRYFAGRWATREGAWADRLRTIPKYVVSSTLAYPAWGTTTVLSGDVPTEVRSLKRQVDGEIVVNDSGQLVHTLWEHGLVDELRVIVYPFLAGDGQRLPLPEARRPRWSSSTRAGSGRASPRSSNGRARRPSRGAPSWSRTRRDRPAKAMS